MIYNFEQCMDWLLVHEGGYVSHPKDPGGETNMGITARTYAEWLGSEPSQDAIRELSVDDATKIYQQRYWDRICGDELPSGVDWSVFDWAVNSGVGRSARTLQKIIGVTADGGIGPITLNAIAVHDTEKLVTDMYSRRQAFYERLKTFEHFGKGWTRRNEETLEQAIELCRG